MSVLKPGMRCLTLFPEWAHAVCWLQKRIENRPQPPWRSLIGKRVGVHAGAYIGGRKGRPATTEGLEAVEMACFEADLHGIHVRDLGRPGAQIRRPNGEWRRVITGAIVCTAVLARVERNPNVPIPQTRSDPPPPWANPARGTGGISQTSRCLTLPCRRRANRAFGSGRHDTR